LIVRLHSHFGALFSALFPLLLVSMVVCVGLGPVQIVPRTVLAIIAHAIRPEGTPVSWSIGEMHIILDVRIPRVILGALVGGGLAAVGAALQTITRNPLADPYLFGVSSGASVGAVAVLLYAGGALGSLGLPSAAFLGALTAMGLVFFLARDAGGVAPHRLILTGVAVHFVLMAATNALVLAAPDRGADSALFWMLGGFSSARWELLPPAAIAVAVGAGWIFWRAEFLDALSLGDEGAHTLGVQVGQLRLEMFLATALTTGVLVSTSGSVGFIGLVVPHCARWVVGARLRLVIPMAMLMGGIFTIWTDVAARSLFAPRELPLGVMTAAIGGLFFVFILRRRRSL
jgi:iron complex transport system permease protein